MATKTQGDLRQISVHIEEPKAGAFEWVLSEADAEDAGNWQPVQRSRRAASTYKAAMADGLVALESLIDDLDKGPRSSTARDHEPGPETAPESERAGKRAARAAPRQEPPAKPAGRTRTAFGFGVMP